MRFTFTLGVTATVLLSFGMMQTEGLAQNILYSQDFEGLPLGSNIDEGIGVDDPRDAVFTKTGPAGWSIDDTGMPAGGVTEWAGWSFVDPAWWVEVAGDQERSGFLFGTGSVIAVADPDEWDDAPHDAGSFNSFMNTPAISLGGAAANSATLEFDSSWRDDPPQTATITAAFDGGDPVQVLRWSSDPADPDFKDDASAAEIIVVDLPNPAGANEVVFSFGLTEAGNDWWWAVDNIGVFVDGGQVFVEEFDDTVTLGPNVFEGRALPGGAGDVWTREPPAGWSVENMVPGMDNTEEEGNGVQEWAGWSFADKSWWTNVAGDQRRSEFTNGEGTVMVADPDEWDDEAHPGEGMGGTEGWYHTFMTTEAISLEGVEEGSVELNFDSSWRPEFDGNYQQTGNLTVSYDGGDPIEVFLWSSDSASPNFKNDESTNEALTFALDNPAGASEMVLTFGLFDAGNDWWWAVDNIEITGIGGGDPNVCGDFDRDNDVDVADRTIQTINWTGAGNVPEPPKTFADGDCDGDGDVDVADQTGTIQNWTGAQAGNLVDGDDADLVYDPRNGNVTLDASDTASGKILSFVLGTDNNDLRTDNFMEPFINVGTNTDNTVFQIGQTDPLNQGQGPEINLGDIFPAGMTSVEQLGDYLSLAEYASDLGAGGTLDLRLVPEPSGLALALFGLLGLTLRRRRK